MTFEASGQAKTDSTFNAFHSSLNEHATILVCLVDNSVRSRLLSPNPQSHSPLDEDQENSAYYHEKISRQGQGKGIL